MNSMIWNWLLGPDWRAIRARQDKDHELESLLERAWQHQLRERREREQRT